MSGDIALPRLADLRVVATDYDGTLLGPDRQISEATRDILQRLAGTHLEFVVITGRPPRFCGSILDQTQIDTTLICANGAVGYDPVADQVDQYATLDLGLARQLVAELRSRHPDAGFCAEMGRQFVAERRWYEAAGRPVEGDIDLLDAHLDPTLHKLLISLPGSTPDAALAAVSRVVGERANPMHAGLPFIEIMPSGVDKAFGLERWCASQGIERSQVLAFGDMPNDIAMLRWAGCGVAVGNAHEDAKAAADAVTGTNVDDGVAAFLAQVLDLG